MGEWKVHHIWFSQMKKSMSRAECTRVAGGQVSRHKATIKVKADVFDNLERFYNPKRRHSTIGYQTIDSNGMPRLSTA